jgi:ribosomal protein S12 methylthiotransferase RimO
MANLKVSITTLGCSRNEVDSEELAGRLANEGWELISDPSEADIAVVNTCGFIESAKSDSINTLLEANGLKSNGKVQAVVAVGCMAERYGTELAESLNEVDGIFGFDSYQEISNRLKDVLAGVKTQAPKGEDRRKLLPISPIERNQSKAKVEFSRARLNDLPWAPLKIATGCDRRCAFCAIPQFRGAFTSRHPDEILAEANWLSENGVSELFLVSENTTSYGKDLADLTLLEKLLPKLSAIDGIERIRLSYLQPAEIRPSLLQAMVSVDKVLPYFDLSFQHASSSVLRRMRRFGDSEKFLHLISQIRALDPSSGIRSNFIVGFPGETESDFETLCDFVSKAEFDAVGVFPYSDEDGTEGLTLPGKISESEIDDRVQTLAKIVDLTTSRRATKRIGEQVRVLIEDESEQEGRSDHQAPEVDGSTSISPGSKGKYLAGSYLTATVVGSDGVDLIVEPIK